MDMAFLRRAERMLVERQAARFDHSMLVATLASQRRGGADSVCLSVVQVEIESIEDPLVELLLGGPDWRRALAAQRGCFSRAEAGREVNGS